jgi:hypothetical protein
MLTLWWWFGICNYELYCEKIKYVDELTLKNAWDLCCEYDIYWWIDIEDMYENICEWVCEIFGLRIVMINGRWWNWLYLWLWNSG